MLCLLNNAASNSQHYRSVILINRVECVLVDIDSLDYICMKVSLMILDLNKHDRILIVDSWRSLFEAQ